MNAPRFGHGLIVGKFYPPHSGHLGVVERAATECDRVSVVVAAASNELIPLGDRVDWLGWAAAIWPHVNVIGTMDDHPIDYDDPVVWDAHEAVFREAVTEIAGGVDVDAVFTGEDYGDELAHRFGATHIRFRRLAGGVSGTRLRADLAGNWHDLVEPARVALARRIVVLGAESTGTTTLARELAASLAAAYVPEYGRTYSAAKLAAARQTAYAAEAPRPWMDGLEWTSDEFELIAARQTQAIDSACLPHSVVVADTDALATSVWHDRYIGGPHPAALTLATANRPDTYILTSPEGVPFAQDGLRDGETVRDEMHQQFVLALAESRLNWVAVSGSREERLRLALRACAPVLQPGRWFSPATEQPTATSESS